MNVRKIVETVSESDKRVDYLKYFNTAGITIVLFLAGYMSADVRDIKSAQQVQAVELMRLDTNQKTIFKSVEALNVTDKERGVEMTKMKIEWINAINELNQKIKR